MAWTCEFDTDPLLTFHGDKLKESEKLKYVVYISSTGVMVIMTVIGYRKKMIMYYFVPMQKA